MQTHAAIALVHHVFLLFLLRLLHRRETCRSRLGQFQLRVCDMNQQQRRFGLCQSFPRSFGGVVAAAAHRECCPVGRQCDAITRRETRRVF